MITSDDGVIAGFQPPRTFTKALSGTLVVGRPQSFWQANGSPGAGVWDNTLNGAVLSSSSAVPNGAIYHQDPVSGNAHLARFALAASAQTCPALILDRLWQNQLTINSTGVQTITFPTLPARDANGANLGDGVLLAIEHNTAASATAAAATVSYTNQAGTAGRTGSLIDATAASATIPGAFFRIGLQAGDTGVRSVQSITFSTAWTTGTIGLVAYRVLNFIEQLPGSFDALTGGLVKLPNGVVPFVVIVPNATTTTTLNGIYIETQG